MISEEIIVRLTLKLLSKFLENKPLSSKSSFLENVHFSDYFQLFQLNVDYFEKFLNFGKTFFQKFEKISFKTIRINMLNP